MKLTIPIMVLLMGAPAPALAAVDATSLQLSMQNFLNVSKPNRSVGNPGHRVSFEYLKQEFEKIAKSAPGSKVYVHEFMPDVDFAAESYRKDFTSQVEGKVANTSPDYKKWKGFTDQAIAFVQSYKGKGGRNLILELKGAKSAAEVVYVGAHYDTITHDKDTMKFTPERATDGADDNASGVVAMLAVARELAGKPVGRTVRFVAFDYEEVFFLGSYALARDISRHSSPWDSSIETVVGLLNLEMIGHSSKSLAKKPVVKIYTRDPKQDQQSHEDLKLAARFTDAAKRMKAKLTPVVLKNGFNRSDNWPFWLFHLPAICVSQDWESDFNEKRYHTGLDTAKSLNWDYLTEVTRAVLATTESLASGK